MKDIFSNISIADSVFFGKKICNNFFLISKQSTSSNFQTNCHQGTDFIIYQMSTWGLLLLKLIFGINFNTILSKWNVEFDMCLTQTHQLFFVTTFLYVKTLQSKLNGKSIPANYVHIINIDWTENKIFPFRHLSSM